MSQEMSTPAVTIANELRVKTSQVEAAIRLLDDGATVPFIARYRKEATAGLDDKHLRILAERLHYLRELDERRHVVLQTIREQEKLTDDLLLAINQADTKTRLEDLYLPFKPKRRNKAILAKEAGLEPLAQALWQDPSLDPESHALSFINEASGVADVPAALEGARQILLEQFAEEAELIQELRQYLWKHGVISAAAAKGQKAAGNKFADYFTYREPIHKIPSHRALALFRGRRESALQLTFALPDNPDYGETRVAAYFHIHNQQRPADGWLMETVRQAWKLKLFPKLELELFSRLRELADEEAIQVFARNLRDLLLAAPAGHKVIMGLDPGIRTGVKVVVVDATGKLLDYTAVFPLAPHNEWHQSIAGLAKLAAKHHVSLVSIGNGTGSRETERLVAEMVKMYPDLSLAKITVNEAGASVYSASELAALEFPDLDVSLRGAVSIARRLQDPLAELVKIEPKSIGVGQYQHDVNQARLTRSLDGVVEDCVNAVGVDVNTASVALLKRVSGLNEALAKNLVQFRDEHGAFQNREQLKNIPRMGEKTFQQCAGFLRIMQGDNPLDASSVHPEAYPLVEKMLADMSMDLQHAIGNLTVLQRINPDQYVDEHHGLPTVCDVLKELEKPGRDPRPEFRTASFTEGIEDISHLSVGMILEGAVSNVTNFGAFVDIGVHQDGLVHISEMTNRYISDPHGVVKAGEIVKVRVVEVDLERRRIGLSMKLSDEKKQPAVKKTEKPTEKVALPVRQDKNKKPAHAKPTTTGAKKKPLFNTAMADAFAKLKRDPNDDRTSR